MPDDKDLRAHYEKYVPQKSDFFQRGKEMGETKGQIDYDELMSEMSDYELGIYA